MKPVPIGLPSKCVGDDEIGVSFKSREGKIASRLSLHSRSSLDRSVSNAYTGLASNFIRSSRTSKKRKRGGRGVYGGLAVAACVFLAMQRSRQSRFSRATKVHGASSESQEEVFALRNDTVSVFNTTSKYSVVGGEADETVTKRKKKKKKKLIHQEVKDVSLIGERNSGTRWIYGHLSQCFNHTHIRVRDRLVRYKHWFQHDIHPHRKKNLTVVVAMFRNPYHWVEAMRKVPHHAPSHYKKKWEAFVTTPWTVQRPESDVRILEAHRNSTGERGGFTEYTQIKCQDHFSYNQIVSCQLRPYEYPEVRLPFCGHQPQYELRNDGSGLAYSSIVDLRADKIKNFLSIVEWDWINDLYVARYEDLLLEGTAKLLRHLENVTGVKTNCNPYPPQRGRKKRVIKRDYGAWITQHVDWKTEKRIGYKPNKR